MSARRIRATVAGTIHSIFLKLEGKRPRMSLSGADTFEGESDIEIQGLLDVKFKVQGVASTKWEFSLSVVEDGEATEFFKDEGRLNSQGFSRIEKDIEAPPLG